MSRHTPAEISAVRKQKEELTNELADLLRQLNGGDLHIETVSEHPAAAATESPAAAPAADAAAAASSSATVTESSPATTSATETPAPAASSPPAAAEKKAQEFPPPSAAALKIKLEGNALFEKKQYKDALKKYSEAVKADPTSAVLYFNKSSAEFVLHDFKNALIDARKACELAPRSTPALSRLALTLTMISPPNYSEAEKVAQQACDLDPTNAKLKQSLDHIKQLKLHKH